MKNTMELTQKDTVRYSPNIVASAKADAKAHEQAVADMKTTKTPVLHNINTGKPVTEKVATPPKKESKPNMAHILDEIVKKGGTWDVLVTKANTANIGNIKYNASVIKAHIHYRTQTQKQNDYLGDLKVTDEGVMPAKGKSKK
jgi:hypothetical protein